MTEKEMRETITSVFNALLNCETKGKSTFIIADSLRALERIINSPITEEPITEEINNEVEDNE